eukprot:m.25506 g.25506  ORF g.25506 m.25506 type:complete len:569 (+) comp5772_c0_seq1:134-1840(+)
MTTEERERKRIGRAGDSADVEERWARELEEDLEPVIMAGVCFVELETTADIGMTVRPVKLPTMIDEILTCGKESALRRIAKIVQESYLHEWSSTKCMRRVIAKSMQLLQVWLGCSGILDEDLIPKGVSQAMTDSQELLGKSLGLFDTLSDMIPKQYLAFSSFLEDQLLKDSVEGKETLGEEEKETPSTQNIEHAPLKEIGMTEEREDWEICITQTLYVFRGVCRSSVLNITSIKPGVILAVHELLRHLGKNGKSETIVALLRVITGITYCSEMNATLFSKFEGTASVLNVLRERVDEEDVQYYGFYSILNLGSFNQVGSKMVSLGAEEVILASMSHYQHSPRVLKSALVATWSLASSSRAFSFKKAFTAVISAAIANPEHATLQENAAGAIRSMALRYVDSFSIFHTLGFIDHILRVGKMHLHESETVLQLAGAMRNLILRFDVVREEFVAKGGVEITCLWIECAAVGHLSLKKTLVALVDSCIPGGNRCHTPFCEKMSELHLFRTVVDALEASNDLTVQFHVHSIAKKMRHNICTKECFHRWKFPHYVANENVIAEILNEVDEMAFL